MTSPSMQWLGRWAEAWRYPRLFVRIHGRSNQPPSPSDLVADMLAGEQRKPREAWQEILEVGDLAAVAAAYHLLAPAIGVDEARAKLDESRAAFRRRVDRLRARARLLEEGWATIEAELAEAEALCLTSPATAEDRLARAATSLDAAERAELDRLRARHPEFEAEPSAWRFREAVEARDLRLARIYTSQITDDAEEPSAAAQPLRLQRVGTLDLLRWRLQPTIAPAWLPPINLTDADLDLLLRLEIAMERQSLSEDSAEGLVRGLIRCALGTEPGGFELTTTRPTDGETIGVTLLGEAAVRLFPHAVDHECRVELVFPRNDTSRLSVAPEGRCRVAWDVFELWSEVVRADEIVVLPRMLLDLLPHPADRERLFVRLQSRRIPIRTLLRNVVGRDEQRCLRIAGQTSSSISGAQPRVLRPLLEALDLYVDDADVYALGDASGGCVAWLLLALDLLASELDPQPATNRRLDVLDLLRRPEIDRRLYVSLESELLRLEDPDGAALVIDAVEDVFDRVRHTNGIPHDQLINDLLLEGVGMSREEVEARLTQMASLGLLDPPATDGQWISCGLPLPGRIVKRRLEAPATIAKPV